MSSFKTNIWGFDIEVEYEYTPYDSGDYFTPPTPEDIEVCEYRFLGELPDFENDVDQKWLEEKIEEAAMAHERAQRHQERLLRPYLTARRMRNRDI